MLKERLEEGFHLLNLTVTPSQLDLFGKFFQFYHQSQEKLNLSSLISEEDFSVKHILDSAAAFPFFSASEKVADLGSGGGFPGVVLKILNPDLKVDLVDVIQKKTDYLAALCAFLDVRAGVFNATRQRVVPCYDTVTCRAFGSLEKIVQQSKKLLVKKGKILAYKGKKSVIEQEIYPAIAKKTRIFPLTVPFLDGERNLVEIQSLKG